MSNQIPGSPVPDIVGPEAPEAAAAEPTVQDAQRLLQSFDDTLIKKYPRSNRKISLEVSTYSLLTDHGQMFNGQSIHISPYGMEFQAPKGYPEGTLLKINVNLPDYWVRKQRFVEYRRIDAPGSFRILAKVVKIQDIGKRGKKKIITVQTVNMDEVDEQVLKSYLQEG